MNQILFDVDSNVRFNRFNLFDNLLKKFNNDAIFAFILIDVVNAIKIQKNVEFFDRIFENLQTSIARQTNIAQSFTEMQKKMVNNATRIFLWNDLTHALKKRS